MIGCRTSRLVPSAALITGEVRLQKIDKRNGLRTVLLEERMPSCLERCWFEFPLGVCDLTSSLRLLIHESVESSAPRRYAEGAPYCSNCGIRNVVFAVYRLCRIYCHFSRFLSLFQDGRHSQLRGSTVLGPGADVIPDGYASSSHFLSCSWQQEQALSSLKLRLKSSIYRICYCRLQKH